MKRDGGLCSPGIFEAVPRLLWELRQPLRNRRDSLAFRRKWVKTEESLKWRGKERDQGEERKKRANLRARQAVSPIFTPKVWLIGCGDFLESYIMSDCKIRGSMRSHVK
jgi:hypothetical protein